MEISESGRRFLEMSAAEYFRLPNPNVFYCNKIIKNPMKHVVEEYIKHNKLKIERRADDLGKRMLPKVDFLAKKNWTFDTELDIQTFNSKSDTETLEWLEKYYTEDDYVHVFERLDTIIDCFKENSSESGYLKQLLTIKNLLKDDFNNYSVLMSCMFSIIEYKIFQRMGKIETTDIFKHEKAVNMKNSITSSDKNTLLILMSISVATNLRNFWSFGEFENGIDFSKFGRHAVQHGRINPERYKPRHIIQLILLLLGICLDENLFSDPV